MASITAAARQDPSSSRESVGPLAPVAPDSRIMEIDIVRGFALFLVLLENMHLFGADSLAWTAVPDKLAFALMEIFVESKDGHAGHGIT